MLRLCARTVLFAALLMGAATASAQTPTWSAYATVSATTTLVKNRICYSDGRDIICDTSAPTLGGVGASDRITSGTQIVSVNQSTGTVSLTTGGTDWGYLRSSGLSYLPGLSTGQLGIGTAAPSAPLEVSGSQIYLNATSAPNLLASFVISTTIGRVVLGVADNPGNFSDFATPGDVVVRNGFAGVGQNLILSSRTVSGSLLFGTGFPDKERMRIANNGNVGIGMTAPNSALDVSGTVSATDVKLAANGTISGPDTSKCAGPNDYGRIVYSKNNKPYICVDR